MTSTGLDELIARTRYVLLDFDGPICSVFAGIPAPTVASRLTKILFSAGVAPPAEIIETDDPFDVLRYATTHTPELAADIETVFRAEELAAIASAAPTPGAAETIHACHDTSRPVAIVSNNSEPAISAYLTTHNLTDHIACISTRTHTDIARLKPHPHLACPRHPLPRRRSHPMRPRRRLHHRRPSSPRHRHRCHRLRQQGRQNPTTRRHRSRGDHHPHDHTRQRPARRR
jgi:hypothetical protein